MFDEFQKPGGYEPRWIGARILAGGAVGLLIALGLCGVGSVVNSQHGLSVVNVLAFYLFLASCLAVVVAAVTTIFEVIVMVVRNGWSRSRKGKE